MLKAVHFPPLRHLGIAHEAPRFVPGAWAPEARPQGFEAAGAGGAAETRKRHEAETRETTRRWGDESG